MVYLHNSQKIFHGAGCLYFLAFGTKKYTNCFVAVRSDFVFSSTITANVETALQFNNAKLYFAKRHKISQ